MKITMLTAVVYFFMPMLTIEAFADIYRYFSDDGTISFTDAPTRPAVRIVREKLTSRATHYTATITDHHSVTGFAKKRSMSRSNGEGQTNHKLIAPVDGTVTSPLGYRHDPLDGKIRLHHGVDIAVPSGTPVRAAARGIVTFSGNRSGYGNLVIVEHEDGAITLYGHNSVNVAHEGANVGPESTIALSGSTGRSTGPHLHFEAWKGGANVTSSFLRGGTSQSKGGFGETAFRRFTAQDGSLILTNVR